MMDAAELNLWMGRHFTRSAFRLETLQAYEVASDGSDYKRYLDGEPTWTPERKQPWLDHLAAERANGLLRSRIRVVRHPVSDYTRYECEWGYVPNVAAGETVRVYDMGASAPVDRTLADWWFVVDRDGDSHAALMHYAEDGSFLGAGEVREADRRCALAKRRDEMWADAEPFPSWWERHPELHRDGAPVG